MGIGAWNSRVGVRVEKDFDAGQPECLGHDLAQWCHGGRYQQHISALLGRRQHALSKRRHEPSP
jgi:hypothetical protein